MAKKQSVDDSWKDALVGAARRRKQPFPKLEEVEAEHIDRVLVGYGNNLVHAARALGISRSTLYRKLAKREAQKPTRRRKKK